MFTNPFQVLGKKRRKTVLAIEEVLGEIRVALSSASVVIIPTLREEFSYPKNSLVSSKGD